jgi:hypothetical protein
LKKKGKIKYLKKSLHSNSNVSQFIPLSDEVLFFVAVAAEITLDKQERHPK